MFLRNPKILLLIGCLLLSVFGFYLFFTNARPIPNDLITASGVVASAEAARRRSHRPAHTIWFTLEGESQRFAYPGILPRIRDAEERIEVGAPVVVIYANKPDANDRVELWGLSISGVELVSPSEARSARLKNGYFGLAIGLVFAGYAVYTWRQVKRGRPA